MKSLFRCSCFRNNNLQYILEKWGKISRTVSFSLSISQFFFPFKKENPRVSFYGTNTGLVFLHRTILEKKIVFKIPLGKSYNFHSYFSFLMIKKRHQNPFFQINKLNFFLLLRFGFS